jgi:signal peptidase I
MIIKSKNHEWVEWVQAIVFAVVIAYIIKFFLFDIIEVDGNSMYPTLHDKDRLIVSKINYKEPNIGDIIIFKYPADENLDFIKRIVAKEGDKVEIKNNYLYINNKKIEEPYINDKQLNDFSEVIVPENSFFVLGDNRNSSRDSRYSDVGFLDEDNIKGKAIIRIWPIESVGILNRKR